MSMLTQVAAGLARLASAVTTLNARFTTKWISDTPPNTAHYSDWYKLDGSHFIWDGTAWFQSPGIPGSGGGSTTGKKPQLWM